MAVVDKYGQALPDPSTYSQPLALYRGNPVRSVVGLWSIANGDSANSRFFLGKVPSTAILLPTGLLTHTAVTGATDVDFGFLEDPDALADGLNISSAGTKNPLASVSTANLLKRAWEHAGLTSDPGRDLTLIGTLKADAGAAGTVHFFVPFVGVL